MAGDHDDVVLSESELERLAEIQESLALSDRAMVERFARPRQLSRARLWMASVLVTLGHVVAVVTFTRWLWVAVGGLALMTAGTLLGAPPLAARARAEVHRRCQSPGGATGAKR